MSFAPLRPCAHPGCYELVIGVGYCDRHRNIRKEIQHAREGNRLSPSARGYDHAWRQFRLRYLAEHPYCVHCKQSGKLVMATEIDHIVAHKGDQSLFKDIDNLQPLCKRCHSVKTSKEGRWGK